MSGWPWAVKKQEGLLGLFHDPHVSSARLLEAHGSLGGELHNAIVMFTDHIGNSWD